MKAVYSGSAPVRADGLERLKRRVLFLELGVGMNTPSIIKYPFWQMTCRNKNARYACINLEVAYAPDEIADRSVCMAKDLGETLKTLRKACKNA